MQSSMRRMGLLLQLQPSKASHGISVCKARQCSLYCFGITLVLVHPLLKGKELDSMSDTL